MSGMRMDSFERIAKASMAMDMVYGRHQFRREIITYNDTVEFRAEVPGWYFQAGLRLRIIANREHRCYWYEHRWTRPGQGLVTRVEGEDPMILAQVVKALHIVRRRPTMMVQDMASSITREGVTIETGGGLPTYAQARAALAMVFGE